MITGQCMGLSLNEFNDIKHLEVVTFRRCILEVCQAAIAEREKYVEGEIPRVALYKYPANTATKAEPPEHVRTALRECMFEKLYYLYFVMLCESQNSGLVLFRW